MWCEMTVVGLGEGGDVRRSTKVREEIWHSRGYCEMYVRMYVIA